MARAYNFSAGPSIMPEYVLNKAANELLDFNNSGQSVMEMSHRSSEFKNIIEETEQLLRKLMNIPDNYTVLFLQGGASSQFSMIPLNLMNKNNKADFVITGVWSNKAYLEACKYGNCNIIASSSDKNFSYIPKLNPDTFTSDADYFHICLNNTIYGTKFNDIPDTNNVPLIADISSCILSEPLDISKFGMLYAGAQKNLGCAGLTVVILRNDLIDEPMNFTPTMFNYKVHSRKKSLYNTPPTYAIYICNLMLHWLQEHIGGTKNMQRINQKKAELLYEFIDNSNLFFGTANVNDRSIMNVTFSTNDKSIDDKFISKAKSMNIINICGHRKVGGMRASIYNAMPLDYIYRLIDFMENFEKSI